MAAEALANERSCIVRAAVVDNDHFISVRLRVAKAKYLLQTWADSVLFIKGRDDQRQGDRAGFHALLNSSSTFRARANALLVKS